MMQKISFIAAVVLPFWNLPLIFRIIRRRSAEDISAFWAVGVWACLVLMAPSGFTSPDIIWKVFSVINFALFSCVLAVVLWYKTRGDKCKK